VKADNLEFFRADSTDIVSGLRPLPFSTADIAAVLAPLDRARPLPPRAYWDEAVFAFEREEIFERAFLCVGREDEIDKPGEWLRAPVTEEGVLVVRGADLSVRAFYNVCRHRAATLLEGSSGRLPCIECPYHGWTYELSGALSAAPHAPPGFDLRAHGLRPVKLEAWQGFLFVTLDPEAPSIERALSGAPPWLSRALPPLRRGQRSAYEVRANWKLIVENFQESHHFPLVHPALDHLTPCDDAQSVLSDGPWLGGIMDLIPDAETVSKSGKRGGRPFLSPEGERRRVFDAMLFPGLLLSLQPDYLLTYRIYPEAPDRTRIIADTYFHPAAFSAGFDPSDVLLFWEEVNRQDRAICERQQVGVRSRGYTASRYTLVEDGVHAFDRLVARRYESGLVAVNGS
jgi:glycine betaine catabolism A